MGTEEQSGALVRICGEARSQRGREIRDSGKKMEETLLVGEMRISFLLQISKKRSLLVRQ